MIRFPAVGCSIVWLLVFSTGFARGAEASREQQIRIAYVSPVTTMAPIWIASEIGAYKREGLDARIIYIDSIFLLGIFSGRSPIEIIELLGPPIIPCFAVSDERGRFVIGLNPA